MIVDYDKKYDNEIKNLMIELQEYIVSIDKEKYNVLIDEYAELYLKKTIEEIEMYQGKMLLYMENNNVLGFIVGIINNDEINTYDFKVPKRGRITELIVNKNIRTKGIGKKLLNSMEDYLKKQGCHDILIGVFAYNDNAINFYNKHGYHTRMIEMTKVNI